MNRDTLVKNIVEKIENGVFVEIGTFQGGFAEFILENNKTCTLYCIDPYISYTEYDDGMKNIVGDTLYNETYKKLKSKFGDRVIFIRKFSEDAVHDIPDLIDFLYIDGNHRYVYTYKDLELYFPKVKNGCFIIGDDAVDHNESARNENGDVLITYYPGCYGHYGVIKAFREFIQKNNLRGEIFGNQFVIKK